MKVTGYILSAISVFVIYHVIIYCISHSTNNSQNITAKDYYDRGEFDLKVNDYTKAINDLTMAIQLNPNYAEAYFDRGRAKESNYLFNQGISMDVLESSILDFNMAIQLNPNYANYYWERGNAESLKGSFKGGFLETNDGSYKSDYNAAIADYTKEIELNPNDSNAYRMRGNLEIKLGQKDNGDLDLKKAEDLHYKK